MSEFTFTAKTDFFFQDIVNNHINMKVKCCIATFLYSIVSSYSIKGNES